MAPSPAIDNEEHTVHLVADIATVESDPASLDDFAEFVSQRCEHYASGRLSEAGGHPSSLMLQLRVQLREVSGPLIALQFDFALGSLARAARVLDQELPMYPPLCNVLDSSGSGGTLNKVDVEDSFSVSTLFGKSGKPDALLIQRHPRVGLDALGDEGQVWLHRECR